MKTDVVFNMACFFVFEVKEMNGNKEFKQEITANHCKN